MDERGWFAFAKCDFVTIKMNQNKMDIVLGTSTQPRWVTFLPLKATVHRRAEPKVRGEGERGLQSWHRGVKPSACQDCFISDLCSGSPVFPPQMDSLQKGVSHAWPASQ